LTRFGASAKVSESAFWWGFVAGFVFQGGSALTLDGKGRVTVPSRHREVLAAVAADQLTITKHPNRCLLVFPRPAWEPFREKLVNLTMGGDGWRRIFLGSAVDVEIDGASRVLVPPELRAWAGLERDVMLLGMGQRFELWDRVRLEAHEAEVLTAPMPSVLQDLVI
jgi:MraZ protein